MDNSCNFVRLAFAICTTCWSSGFTKRTLNNEAEPTATGSLAIKKKKIFNQHQHTVHKHTRKPTRHTRTALYMVMQHTIRIPLQSQVLLFVFVTSHEMRCHHNINKMGHVHS